MKKFFLTVLIFTFLSAISFAQDTLPKIKVEQVGKRVLVSWVNNYTNITNINIQRSADSLRRFTTIGSVLNVDTRNNGFVDTKEFIPSNQYYRLFISFKGGGYLFTESHRPIPDSTFNLAGTINEQTTINTWFTPSIHVYTGRDNNVIIHLPDAGKKRYSLIFYEENGEKVFELKRIPQDYLTLDKVNFLHSGLFDFELYDNRILIERHKVYIPKDGRPASTDINGPGLRRK